MPFHLDRVPPHAAVPVLARLYGCREQEFAQTAAQLTLAWIIQERGQQVLGALGLRPSPAHGAEVLGGAFSGGAQQEAGLALIRRAVETQPHLYAYAEEHLFPAETLRAAGLRPVGAYTRMTGPLPLGTPAVPDGFRLVPLAEVSDPGDLVAAQRTYSDRIGHTHVPDDAGQPGFGGSDDPLGRLAYDARGVPAGLCRASLTGQEVTLGTPGVRAEARGTGLRETLLLSVFVAARTAGATHLSLEAWGDTEAERAQDEALGLLIRDFTPIYAAVP